MARIRTIKPQFFLNEELAELPYEHRLLFVGLWTQADREGRLEDRPKRLKAELFPYDAVDMGGMLDRLHNRGFIQRYTVADKRYIQVVKFLAHQYPHIKEPNSTIPAPCKNGASPVPVPVPPVGREGKGKEGKREKMTVKDLALRAFMQHTNQALKTKTGNQQAGIARQIYGLAVAFIADHPERQAELSTAIDMMPRAMAPGWYPQAVRSWIAMQRWEEVKAQPPIEALKELTASIGRHV